MIDIHTHLFFPDYDADREAVVKRAFASGIQLIISVGTSPEDNVKAIEISQLDDRIYASVGLHPHYFMKHETYNMKQGKEALRILTQDPKVVAIGEAGLDYFLPRRQAGSRMSEPISEEQRTRQKEGLLMQMELARELELPMILHCRDAYEDLLDVLITNHHSLPTILHCYMGDTEITKKFLQLPNVYFSFTGNITYPVKKVLEGTKDDLRETIKLIPLERMLTETDCPFLAPQSHRGERNEPSFVTEVGACMAEIKGIDRQFVERQIEQNAQHIFRKHIPETVT